MGLQILWMWAPIAYKRNRWVGIASERESNLWNDLLHSQQISAFVYFIYCSLFALLLLLPYSIPSSHISNEASEWEWKLWKSFCDFYSILKGFCKWNQASYCHNKSQKWKLNCKYKLRYSKEVNAINFIVKLSYEVECFF